jgi:transcriptional regulator with XRE-family HTH domain
MGQLTVAEVIAGNVRSRREINGWTQDEMAARLRTVGLPWGQSSLSRFEKGQREPTVSELILLAAAFKIAPADLVTGPTADVVQIGEAVAAADSLARLLTERDEIRANLFHHGPEVG